MAKLSVSILACNHAKIGEQVKEAEQAGADIVHIDIMDGVYVENITFGPQLVKDLKEITHLPISIHMELLRPETYIKMFANAGADSITFQLDTCPNPIHLLRTIREYGIEAGVGIGPSHSVEPLRYLLPHVNKIILMSVEPGYGGQPFENGIYQKISQTLSLMEEEGVRVPIAVDGGISIEKGEKLMKAGVEDLIVGNSVFQTRNIREAIHGFKNITDTR